MPDDSDIDEDMLEGEESEEEEEEATPDAPDEVNPEERIQELPIKKAPAPIKRTTD
jgi:hypothetical protein